MGKAVTQFVCKSCGTEFSKWQGQCHACQQWNSLIEALPIKGSFTRAERLYHAANSQVTCLKDVSLSAHLRLQTGLDEFNRVLGGGLVSDSVVLIGGDPGIGKSTLLLQVLCDLSKRMSTLYVTGEESLHQIASRANRLGVYRQTVKILAETNVERILALAAKEHPDVLVIDSVQTIHTHSVSSTPSSVTQLKESTAQLIRYAKEKGAALILVGHVTKTGVLAGPRILEHMVDTVLYFEGDERSRYRMIRAVKNRFGAVNELGVFAMTNKGLKEVLNPSAIFLNQHDYAVSGSAVMVAWEGSRPLLVEIQALVDQSYLSNPRRMAIGLEYNRLSMLLAVLHRHTKLAAHDRDVFISAVGGLRVAETAADLSIILAVLSSLRNKPLPSHTVIFGELGLSGEIRPVPNGQARLKEAAKHGFKKAIIPHLNLPKQRLVDMEMIGCRHIQQAVKLLSSEHDA
jgi:DNA repair protein RadA/Sms